MPGLVLEDLTETVFLVDFLSRNWWSVIEFFGATTKIIYLEELNNQDKKRPKVSLRAELLLPAS